MSPSDLFGITGLVEAVVAHLTHVIQTPAGIIGFFCAGIAALLIVISSFVKMMIPLRWLAIGSNLGFVIYGIIEVSLMTLLLQGLLLPINIYRAIEMQRLTRRVTLAAKSGDTSGVWLKPYMKARKLKANDILFNKGDTADQLYLLAEGRVEFVEIGEFMDPGRVFGEIAFFAPNKRRTQTARCAQDCTVLCIDETTVKQLFYQNPKFGFEMVGLVAGRLSADVGRLQDQLRDAKRV